MAKDRPRILVIDDDPDLRDAVKLILEPEGYQVECAATGPEGMQALQKSPPDLLLLDIMLSTPTEGFHLAYEMGKDEKLRRIPIIMISAIGQTMGLDIAKESGSDYVPAAKFLEKPLSATELRQAVRDALQCAG